jgi:regulator of sigma E protease
VLTFLRDHVSWLAPVLVFGLLIFVHELGHFIAAKATGVYAPRFSIGFGPALWARRWGETEYQLAVFPLGGYVRMASRDDEPAAILEGGSEESPAAQAAHQDPNAMMPFGPRPIPPNRWFESKPLWARLVIMLGGVTMNAVLAYVILAGINLYYGRPVPSDSPVFDYVLPQSAGAAVGLTGGDSVVAVGGQPITGWKDLVAHVSPYPNVPISITVMSHGTARTVTVTPRPTPDTNFTSGVIRTVGKIGAAPRLDGRRHPMPLPQALTLAWRVTGNMAGLIFVSVHDLVTRKESLTSLAGPVGIARMSVETARSGLESLWTLIALLSINLAILNLLPIPILDGGQILVNVLEAVKGRPFSLRTREYILRVGLVAIGALFLLVMFNDGCRVFSGLC